MAVLEALTTGNGTITAEKLNATMKSYLGKETNFTGDGPWQYQGEEGAYAITSSGSVAKGWITNYNAKGSAESVTNGTITLSIGDYINYDPGTEAEYMPEAGTVQETTYYVAGPDSSPEKVTQLWLCANAEDYQKLLDEGKVKKGTGYSYNSKYSASDTQVGDTKWKVIGADEETGELLIMATDVIKTTNKDNKKVAKKLVFSGITGYLYGIEELNKVCNVYGQGKGATGGRSLTYDDVEKTIGIKRGNPNPEYTYTWTPNSNEKHSPSYNGGTNYLNYWHTKADEKLAQAYINGGYKDKSLLETTSTGVFNFYNTTTGKWETNTQELNGLKETKTIGKIKPNYTSYYVKSSEDAKATKGYDIIFKTGDGNTINENTTAEDGSKVRR